MVNVELYVSVLNDRNREPPVCEIANKISDECSFAGIFPAYDTKYWLRHSALTSKSRDAVHKAMPGTPEERARALVSRGGIPT